MGTISYEKRQAFLNDPNDKRHGTARGYQLKCRCERCKEAGVEYNQLCKERAYRRQVEKPKGKRVGKDCCTVNELYFPMMGKPDIDNANGLCCICGRPASDKHHIVKRSAGKLVVNGREVKKPTVRLCGSGNASGCHGKAHKGLIHFRWAEPECDYTKDGWMRFPYGAGHWECLMTDEPMKYQEALKLDGWRRL